MTDLSFNIIALTKYEAAFTKFSEQIDRLAKKIDQLDGKKADVDVNVKTDESTKLLDSFTNRFALMTAGVLAASPLAGAAIVGGIGAGFVGLAVLAQKSNVDVQKTFTTLWSNVVSDTKQGTADLVPQIVGAGNQIGAAASRLAPQLKAGFSAAGPDIVALSRGVTDFASNAMPGVVSAMQNSEPVFTAVANVAGVLGTAVGSSIQSIGQNSQQYGTDVQSFGNIASTVLGVATVLINDLAQAWAKDGSSIEQAVTGLGTTLTGLAQGVLPVLNFTLSTAAGLIQAVTAVLGPLAPALGGVGAAALVTWAAFKAAEVVSGGVRTLANNVANLGTQTEAGAAKAAVAVAAMNGETVAASATATAVKAAGASAATAATGFGVMADTLAGPLGIALIAGVALIGIFASGTDKASIGADKLKVSLDGVTSALEASNGAVNASVIKNLEAEQQFKDAAAAADKFGVSQSDLAAVIVSGGPALEDFRKKLQGIIDANHNFIKGRTGRMDIGLNELGQSAQTTLDKLNALAGGFTGSKQSADQNRKSLEAHATTLANSAEGMTAAGYTASRFGEDLLSVRVGFANIAQTSGDASIGVEDVQQKFETLSIATANASAAISDGFKNADRAVRQAQVSVADAAHSAQQASRGIADAAHSAQQASRGVADARRAEAQAALASKQAAEGVADSQHSLASAERSLIQAQDQERQSQVALSEARQQAIRDLKSLHEQLDNAYTSQASARVRLFDTQQVATGLGITDQNAKDIAGQTVTAENEDKVKAAIDLLSAQNSLNQAVRSGTELAVDTAKADALGVEGSKGVTSALQAVQSAHQSVSDSSYALEQSKRALIRAQQAVSDAAYNEQRAHQAVADAAYGEKRAHEAVTDAQYASKKAADQLSNAKIALSDAEDAASRSLDITTAAGRRNVTELQNLAAAIKAEFGPSLDGYNTLINDTADKFGMSRQAAADYLKQIGLIPQNFTFIVTAVAALDSVGLWDSIPSPSGHGNASLSGPRKMYASGGPIFGEGGPREDKVPLWASPGEWIQPADSVNFYGTGFMEAIRTRKFPKFADGGMVEANALLASLGAAYQSSTQAAIVMGLPHAALLPSYVKPSTLSFSGTAGSGVRGDRAANRSIVMSTFASMFGWSSTAEQAAIDYLLMRESGYNNLAQNPTSTAFGMFQFLNSTWGGYGVPKTSDPTAQTVAGGRYLAARYGDPINAAAHERAYNWYASGGPVKNMPFPYGTHSVARFDNGGVLEPGALGWNGSGKPENVRSADAEDRIVNGLDQVVRAIGDLAKRPIRGDAVLDGGRVVGMLTDAARVAEHNAGVGVL